MARSTALLLVLALCHAQLTLAFFKSWGRPAPEYRDAPHVDVEALTGAENGTPGPASVPPAVAQKSAQLLAEYQSRTSFSSCWKDAVAKLQDTCEQALTDDETRSRLGLHFTTCQLQADGKGELAPACPEVNTVKACTSALDSQAYMVYVQFRIHVDTMCFHVQQELFQARSDAAVARLQAATRLASGKLQELGVRTDEWSASVDQMKQQQQAAVSAGESLGVALERLDTLEQGLLHTISAKVKPVGELGERLDVVLSKQETLENAHREAATKAEKLAQRNTDVLDKLGLSTQQLGEGITAAKAATAALSNDQKSVSATLGQMKSAVGDVHELQIQSAQRALAVAKNVAALADAAESRLESQREQLERLQTQTSSLVTESMSHQNSIAESSTSLLRSIAQVQEFQEAIATAVISFETSVVYVAAAVAVILFTVPERTQGARFAALVMGPLSCFFVERFHVHEAASMLAALGFGEDPWAQPRSATATMTHIHSVFVPQIRQVFAGVVVMLLAVTAARYETPEQRQRRVVESTFRRVLKDPEVLDAIAAAAAARARSGFSRSESNLSDVLEIATPRNASAAAEEQQPQQEEQQAEEAEKGSSPERASRSRKRK